MPRVIARFLGPFVVAPFLVAWLGALPFAIAAQNTSGSGAPAHPITQQQLQILFERFGAAEAQKAFIRDAYEKHRSQLPGWFPQSVWNEVIEKVADIDTFPIALPVYQKYVSQETADTLLVFFDGDTGKQLARAWTEHGVQAMHQGYRGGGAALQAEDLMGQDATVDSLLKKRLSELPAEQGNSCLDALQNFNLYIARINDEKNAVYMTKVQETARQVLAEHKAELDAAQRAASHSAPASTH
jgi:hypothetical protein